MAPSLLRREGRRAFGADPSGYLRYRLPYPPRVFEILRTQCGLRRGATVFEIGPGPGLASRELLRAGADPLYLVEPDPRFRRYLASTLHAGRRLRIVPSTFEHADLPEGSFDLGVAATSFHWVPAHRGIPHVARLLRPGGWWAMWWNRHMDPEDPSEFHRAVMRLRSSTRRSWESVVQEERRDSRQEVARRLARLARTGSFDRISFELLRWNATLTPPEVRGLWGTFGNVWKMSAAQKRRLLDGVERIAREEFGGGVRFRMTTTVYTARRA